MPNPAAARCKRELSTADLSLIPEKAWREAQRRAEVIRRLAVLLVQLIPCVLNGCPVLHDGTEEDFGTPLKPALESDSTPDSLLHSIRR